MMLLTYSVIECRHMLYRVNGMPIFDVAFSENFKCFLDCPLRMILKEKVLMMFANCISMCVYYLCWPSYLQVFYSNLIGA